MKLVSNLDDLVPNYLRAARRWPTANSLQEHYALLAQEYAGNSFGLVEATKSFVESVCLTVLADRGHRDVPSRTPITKLLRDTLSQLGIENTKGVSRFDSVLSAYNKLSDALNEVRNDEGRIAHGRDGFIDSLTENQKHIFLLLGDTLLNLVLSAYEGIEPNLQYTREAYDSFLSYHSSIDSEVSVEVKTDEMGSESSISSDLSLIFRTPSLPEGVELRLEPSRLLFNTDRSMYVEILASLQSKPSAVEKTSPEPIALEEAPSERLLAAPRHQTESRITETYSGRLNFLREALIAELATYDLSTEAGDLFGQWNGERLVASLLSTFEVNMILDWDRKDSILARFRLAVREVLLHYGASERLAATASAYLIKWLQSEIKKYE